MLEKNPLLNITFLSTFGKNNTPRIATKEDFMHFMGYRDDTFFVNPVYFDKKQVDQAIRGLNRKINNVKLIFERDYVRRNGLFNIVMQYKDSEMDVDHIVI